MRRILRTIRRELTRAFAPYWITDASGADIFEWTEAAARAWLPYCAPEGALIVNRFAGRAIAARFLQA